MKYVLLICDDESKSSSNDELDADSVHQAWLADLNRRWAQLYGARLRPTANAGRSDDISGLSRLSGPSAQSAAAVPPPPQLAIERAECPQWTD